MADTTSTSQHIVLVTGPSGAGRSTAINALEDLGFEAIDNIPLTLIPRLVDAPLDTARPLALGIDVRNRDFSASGLLDLRQILTRRDGVSPELLFLDCLPEVLERRYSETRRRHPLAPDEAPADGIAREMALLHDVRLHADILIDTTESTVHDLRAEIERWFGGSTGQRMALSVHSFSYKRGLPQGLDMAFDVRFLRNPHWDRALRALTGLDPAVSAYVAEDPRLVPLLDHVLGLLRFALPEAEKEGKAHLSVGFGCTGGKHRSVAVTESVAASLAEDGWPVSIRHRELERGGLSARVLVQSAGIGEATK